MFKKLLIIAMMLLAACGTDTADVELPGEPVCIPAESNDQPDFVGLSLEEATELAQEREWVVREVGRDGECFAVTMDLRDDRINLELIDDVVVGAAIY